MKWNEVQEGLLYGVTLLGMEEEVMRATHFLLL